MKKLVERLWKRITRRQHQESVRSENADLKERVRYLQYEVSQLYSLVRYLLPESDNYSRYIDETRASFDYQWAHIEEGAHLIGDPAFNRDGVKTLLQYTNLPRDWFKGKQVLDAGCGNGRWSWVLCELGAVVTAFDQSNSGVIATQKLCGGYAGFKAFEADTLTNLGMPQKFDMVWSYGVVHHTGNSWLALRNIAGCVKAGGYLWVMVYGEPRWDHVEDYQELNHYIELRHALAALDFDERVEYLRRYKKEEHVHGYFDAASPRINDLHPFSEVADWLRALGFESIQRMAENRNMMIMAQRRMP